MLDESGSASPTWNGQRCVAYTLLSKLRKHVKFEKITIISFNRNARVLTSTSNVDYVLHYLANAKNNVVSSSDFEKGITKANVALNLVSSNPSNEKYIVAFSDHPHTFREDYFDSTEKTQIVFLNHTGMRNFYNNEYDPSFYNIPSDIKSFVWTSNMSTRLCRINKLAEKIMNNICEDTHLCDPEITIKGLQINFCLLTGQELAKTQNFDHGPGSELENWIVLP